MTHSEQGGICMGQSDVSTAFGAASAQSCCLKCMTNSNCVHVVPAARVPEAEGTPSTSTRHVCHRDGRLAYLDGSKSCGGGCQTSSGVCQDRVGVQSNKTLSTGTSRINSNNQAPSRQCHVEPSSMLQECAFLQMTGTRMHGA